MRKILFCIVMMVPVYCFAQLGVAAKAGINFANVTNASSIQASNHTGYMLGAYIAPKPKKALGFRSELILSRQGYEYKTSTNTGNVNLDYLLFPQLATINFSKLVQIHVGAQVAFLLNAAVDSTGSGSGNLEDYFKKFDYGLAAGLEISPFAGLFIGGRINISFNDVSVGGIRPNFVPDIEAKNNVVQLYVGWRL